MKLKFDCIAKSAPFMFNQQCTQHVLTKCVIFQDPMYSVLVIIHQPTSMTFQGHTRFGKESR